MLVPGPTPVAKPAALIVATDNVAECHVTRLVRFAIVPSLSVPVAVNCCAVPCVMEGFAGDKAIDDRLTPVPLNGTLCVETAVPLLLLMLINAVNCATAEGANDTCRLQVTPGPRVAGGTGQPLFSGKLPVFGPVSETFAKVTGVAPGFFTAMVCAALVVPCSCELKMKFGGVTVSVVAADGGGGLATTMPKGIVVAMLVATVFVEALMTATTAPLVAAT